MPEFIVKRGRVKRDGKRYVAGARITLSATEAKPLLAGGNIESAAPAAGTKDAGTKDAHGTTAQ